jgi:hypothetical protein
MSTTDLLVEYLVLGAIADVWLYLLLSFIFPHETSKALSSLLSMQNAMPMLAVIFLALTYTLGGMVNFLADWLFGRMQKKYRSVLFMKEQTDYDSAIGFINQSAAPHMVGRLQYSGHIIRLARGNTLNFTFLSGVLLLFWGTFPARALTGALVSFFFAVLCFFQWKERYESTYNEMLAVYKVILFQRSSEKKSKSEKARNTAAR